MAMSNYTPISMPSLGKIFDMMKSLPPQQAAQDINSPDPAKKLAAMMVTNADKQLQQQQAAQQQPMPTIAQKLSQGMTQAPGMPTPPMPAVPPQAQAKPSAQGIAALQPQQTPPGSAMGILPTQQAPEVQAAPQQPVQRSTGGIASFAAGGQAQASQQQAQKAQQLAQLMQAINQNSVAAVPQQAQQAGIAAPQPGQANPMQNYASMVFATRPQARPGTEAAPISQDLSLSQLGQYSSQQPIAAAHGGLMHHVPDHMYKFAQGGILAFAGKSGSQANLTQAQLDASLADSTGNPGILKQPAIDMAGRDLYDVPFDSAGQNTAPGVNIDPNAVNMQSAAATGNPGIIPGNTLAQAAQAAGNTYTRPNLDTGVQPHVRGNVASPFQGVYDAVGNFFSNQGTTATNPRLGGTSAAPTADSAPSADAQANAAALLNNRNALMGNQAATPVASGPLQLPPTGAGAGRGAVNPPVVTPSATPGGIGSLVSGQAAPTTRAFAVPAGAPPSHTANSLVDDVVKKSALEALKKTNADDELDEQIKVLTKLGINNDAGEAALKRAMDAHQQYKNADDSLERFQRIMSGIAHGGLAGGGAEAANYSAEKRAADYAESRQHMKDLTEAEDKTRGEKKEIAGSVLKGVEEKNKAAGAAAGNLYGHQLTANTTIEAEKLRAANQLAIEASRQAFDAKYKGLTEKQIMDEAAKDPNFLKKYSDARAAALGQSSKPTLAMAHDLYTGAQRDYQEAIKNGISNPGELETARKAFLSAKRNLELMMQGKEPSFETTSTVAPPTMDEFLAKAGPVNPKMSKDQLVAKYKELYGTK